MGLAQGGGGARGRPGRVHVIHGRLSRRMLGAYAPFERTVVVAWVCTLGAEGGEDRAPQLDLFTIQFACLCVASDRSGVCLSCVLRRDVRVASNVFERSNQLT